jgi:hypothetical protein
MILRRRLCVHDPAAGFRGLRQGLRACPAACSASSRGCRQRVCQAADPVSNLDHPPRFPAPQVDWVSIRDRARRRLAPRVDWVSIHDRGRRRLAPRVDWVSTPVSDPQAWLDGPCDPAVDATASRRHAVGADPSTTAWLRVWLAAQSVAVAALSVAASPAAARRDRQVWGHRLRADDRL